MYSDFVSVTIALSTYPAYLAPSHVLLSKGSGLVNERIKRRRKQRLRIFLNKSLFNTDDRNTYCGIVSIEFGRLKITNSMAFIHN